MQRHSKLCVSTSNPMFGLQDWANLPKDLLQSIFSHLGSICDLLAFVATCHAWRVALTSYSSKSTLCTLFPPLLIQPNIRVHVRRPPCNNGHRNLQAYKVIDPAKQSATGLHCHIDGEILQT
uniref:F-box domain-containing protein n=1 Tax=Triticum urartu TaxID=4572 RepID=A0A8R7R0Y6_TRIUA